MPYGTITFTSDYGLDDEFVGVCHAVIAQIAPGARVIDVNHTIPPFDIEAGALLLVRAIQYLPDGVHLAIIDPGVGSDRRAIAVETEASVFVGPDNGVLSPAVQMCGGAIRAVELTSDEHRLSTEAGVTFAGRDIFAPAAAHLAAGVPLEVFGPEVDLATLTPLLLPLSTVESDRVAGEVLWIDRFGNCQTNIDPAQLAAVGVSPGDDVEVIISGSPYPSVWTETYSDRSDESPALLLVVDSYGLVSLAVNRGRASDMLGVDTGTAVQIRRGTGGA